MLTWQPRTEMPVPLLLLCSITPLLNKMLLNADFNLGVRPATVPT
jgi:hypothetical protein